MSGDGSKENDAYSCVTCAAFRAQHWIKIFSASAFTHIFRKFFHWKRFDAFKNIVLHRCTCNLQVDIPVSRGMKMRVVAKGRSFNVTVHSRNIEERGICEENVHVSGLLWNAKCKDSEEKGRKIEMDIAYVSQFVFTYYATTYSFRIWKLK